MNKLSSIKNIVKLAGFAFLLLVAVFAAVFFGQGVKNYFVKASTCPAQKVSAVQVTGNSAVITWETQEPTQGRVEYGTNPTNLTFSTPEPTSGKTHNVPLTLLTPNTIYYYLVTIGNSRCDSTGQVCSGTCVPWSFTTGAITPQAQLVASLTPTSAATISATYSSSPSATPRSQRPTITSGPTPTSGLSSFCNNVKINLGKGKEATNWASLKQFDIDNNGRINGVDVIKCQQSGK